MLQDNETIYDLLKFNKEINKNEYVYIYDGFYLMGKEQL